MSTRMIASTIDPAMIAALAVTALREEAVLTPKPGLVDRRGSGSHTDMDLPLLLRSAESLFDTFRDVAAAGGQQLGAEELRDRVGVLGRIGEATMLDATGGVNTHRGALWTVGLLVTAAAPGGTEAELFARAASLASTADSAGAPPQSSHGQRAVRTYGVPGAVGEASAGFPHISRIALPALRASLSRGESTDRARLRALLALIATVEDTCILHRGGAAGLRWMQRAAQRAQDAHRFDGALERFARRADRRRLSPGGCADLLAGTIFVDSLERAGIPSPVTAAQTATAAREEPSHADL